MNFEAWKLTEEEKKKKEKSEKEKKQNRQRVLEQERRKKEAREKKENKDVLRKLEDMLDEWNILDQDLAKIKDIVDSSSLDISDDEIEEILEKIDEIEKTEDVDKYLPQEFRITSEDYKQSLTDDVKRLQTLTKLDAWLTILSWHIAPDASMWLNLFSWYMAILDKKLIKIQENTIDVKDCLKKVEDIKNPPKKQGFLEKIKDFFKEIFE